MDGNVLIVGVEKGSGHAFAVSRSSSRSRVCRFLKRIKQDVVQTRRCKGHDESLEFGLVMMFPCRAYTLPQARQLVILVCKRSMSKILSRSASSCFVAALDTKLSSFAVQESEIIQ